MSYPGTGTFHHSRWRSRTQAWAIVSSIRRTGEGPRAKVLGHGDAARKSGFGSPSVRQALYSSASARKSGVKIFSFSPRVTSQVSMP
jgi:hypothetical protein